MRVFSSAWYLSVFVLNVLFHVEATLTQPAILCLPYQIKAHLKETVSFSIEHVHNDYSIYENVCISPDEFRHVIEIYDFPSVFKTDDLLDAFTEYRCEQSITILNLFTAQVVFIAIV